MRYPVVWFLGVWLTVVPVSALCGAEPVAESSRESSLVELVSRLDHDRYQVRKAAADALFRRGVEAVEALERAAVEGSLETTHQALQVLARLYRQGDPAAKKAAGEALHRLAQSKHAAAARRARMVVGGQPTGPRNVQAQRVLRVGPGGIRLQIGPAARKKIIANGIAIKRQNGQLEIRRTVPGKEIHLIENAKGIKLQVTQVKNGKKQTQIYQAKTAEELKKKHPQAYKLYKELKGFEKLGQLRRAIRIIPGAPVPGLPQILPVPVKPQRAVPQKALPKAVPQEKKAAIPQAVPRKAVPKQAVPR